jgi:hypothetical protein
LNRRTLNGLGKVDSGFRVIKGSVPILNEENTENDESTYFGRWPKDRVARERIGIQWNEQGFDVDGKSNTRPAKEK